MRVLLDTNVLLDVLLEREPWLENSSRVWQAHDDGKFMGFATATTLTDVYYVGRREKGVDAARLAVRTCLRAFRICEVTCQTLVLADSFSGHDFEDNLQIACAYLASLDGIVTRDKSGFVESALTVWTPEEFLVQADASEGE